MEFEKNTGYEGDVEKKMENDFFVALKEFGVDPSYISKFTLDGDKGWEFTPTDQDQFKKKESDLFLKCVELEEHYLLLEDPVEMKKCETEIINLQKELDGLRRDNKLRQKSGKTTKSEKLN